MSESTERSLVDGPLLGQVLEAADGPAAICDPSGRVRAWNDALAERTGRGDDLADAPASGLFDCGDRRPVARAADERTTTSETGLLRGESDRPCRVECRPLTDDGEVVGVLATATLRDRPEAEWPIYKSSVDAAADVVYVVDEDYTIRMIDEGIETITGYPPEAFIGEHVSCLERYGIADRDTVASGVEAIERVLSGAADQVTFVDEIDVDGETVAVENRLAPVEDDGEVVAAVNVVRDVTERERRMQSLAENRERLATILDNLPVVMMAVDADGTIDYYQGTGADYFRAERDEIVGKSLDVFEADNPEIVAGCRRALDGQESEATVEIDDHALQTVYEPVTERGEVAGALAIGIDVTERVENRRELEATNRRLDLALRNTDAGVFEWQVGDDEVYWHDTLSELLGFDTDTNYRPKEAFRELVHPEDRERHAAAQQRAIEEGGEFAVEVRIDHPEKGERWLVIEGEVEDDENGEPERIVGIDRDITDRKRREREIEERERQLRTVIESSPDPIVMKDTESRYQVINEAVVSNLDVSREEVVGKTPVEVFGEEYGALFERHTREVLEAQEARTFEEYIQTEEVDLVFQTTRAPVYGPDGELQGTVSIIRDVTELKRQQEELESLTEIQQLVQENIAALAAATTEAEIKRTVCERLADSPYYEFAWVGERDPTTGEITPDCSAGIAGDYLDEITITADAGERGKGPGGRAYRTGEVAAAHDVRDDPDFDLWRDAAIEAGFESVAGVPLTHGSVTHGVLLVYADRPDAFSDREIEGFEVLGDVVGFALSAAQSRRLLESETALELEFETRDDASIFIEASEEHDCRFVFEHPVQTGDGQVLYYLTVEDADPEIAREIAAGSDYVDSIRRLEGGPDGPHYELIVSDSVYHYLSESGARGRRAVAENGVGSVVAEVPSDVDVRAIRDALETRYADIDLVAKREREHGDRAVWPHQNELGARLTDRQRTVLRSAYYSGYYEWPRETDSETLADSLNIASTTFLQHLRKGHRQIMADLFDN